MFLATTRSSFFILPTTWIHIGPSSVVRVITMCRMIRNEPTVSTCPSVLSLNSVVQLLVCSRRIHLESLEYLLYGSCYTGFDGGDWDFPVYYLLRAGGRGRLILVYTTIYRAKGNVLLFHMCLCPWVRGQMVANFTGRFSRLLTSE